MDINQYTIEITRHAFIQSLKRGIDPGHIWDTLRNGRVRQYGKHGIKFIQKGTKRTVICVGQITGTTIRIFTIEKGN